MHGRSKTHMTISEYNRSLKIYDNKQTANRTIRRIK